MNKSTVWTVLGVIAAIVIAWVLVDVLFSLLWFIGKLVIVGVVAVDRLLRAAQHLRRAATTRPDRLRRRSRRRNRSRSCALHAVTVVAPVGDRVVLGAVRHRLQHADRHAELLGDPGVGVRLHVDEPRAERADDADGLGIVDEVVARRDRDAVAPELDAGRQRHMLADDAVDVGDVVLDRRASRRRRARRAAGRWRRRCRRPRSRRSRAASSARVSAYVACSLPGPGHEPVEAGEVSGECDELGLEGRDEKLHCSIVPGAGAHSRRRSGPSTGRRRSRDPARAVLAELARAS